MTRYNITRVSACASDFTFKGRVAPISVWD